MVPLSKSSSGSSWHDCRKIGCLTSQSGQRKTQPVKLPWALRVMTPRPSPHQKPCMEILNMGTVKLEWCDGHDQWSDQLVRSAAWSAEWDTIGTWKEYVERTPRPETGREVPSAVWTIGINTRHKLESKVIWKDTLESWNHLDTTLDGGGGGGEPEAWALVLEVEEVLALRRWNCVKICCCKAKT